MTKLLGLLTLFLTSNFLWASTNLTNLEKQINHRLGQSNFKIVNQQTNQIVNKMTAEHNNTVPETNVSLAPNPNCGI